MKVRLSIPVPNGAVMQAHSDQLKEVKSEEDMVVTITGPMIVEIGITLL
jgi:hypothetical protein